MAIFKRVALITLSNIGGELDFAHAKSTEEDDIKVALHRLINNAVFCVGDRITIEEVETEVE